MPPTPATEWPMRRLLAFALLAGYASVRWAHLVSPSADGRALTGTLIGLGLGIALMATAQLGLRRRAVARAGVIVAGVALAFIAAGLPLRMLAPAAWGELSAGIGQGLGALPNTSIPYGGVDEWVRLVIVAGGLLLTLLGAAIAFWPRRVGLGRPMIALLVLALLYGVPAVELHSTRPFVDGAVFTVVASAMLWLERVPIGQGAVAATLVASVVVTGLVVAPRLDAARPWLDYEALANSLSPTAAETFDWEHRYGPFYWARDGREVLRVKAPLGSYWKVRNLDFFDGVRWRRGGALNPRPQDSEFAPDSEGWKVKVRVAVRSMRSSEFIAPGTTLGIEEFPRGSVKVAPGTFATAGRPLRPGDSYIARAYVPRPTADEMTSAGDSYPGEVSSLSVNLAMQLPPEVGGPELMPAIPGDPFRGPTDIYFPAWGDLSPAYSQAPSQDGAPNGAELVLASRYRRTYRLAQSMRAEARTQYGFVRAVLDYLGRGFTYDENVEVHDDPAARASSSRTSAATASSSPGRWR